jgi:hypothetical protein
MAIPTGAGTEVLKVNRYQGIQSETLVFQGVADHIYTILSVIFVNTDTSQREFYLTLYDGTGTSNQHRIIFAQPVPALGTYVFNDKFVISGAYNMRVMSQNGDADVIVSYIDQDWT